MGHEDFGSSYQCGASCLVVFAELFLFVVVSVFLVACIANEIYVLM